MVKKRLSLEELNGLCGELQPWRTDPDIVRIPDSDSASLVFPFAKGLRLSARLTYAIRNALPGGRCHADWGQLVTDEGLCSPECDIIIHKNGVLRRWNDAHSQPVMDFAFVDPQEALAVISCKSLLSSVDTDYPKTMLRYVRARAEIT